MSKEQQPVREVRRNRMLSRLILMFLAVVLPIYALGMYIYDSGIKSIRNEISGSATMQAAYYLDSLAREIERIRILQYDCLNDEYLNRLAIRYPIMSNYEYVDSILQLHRRLITIRNSSPYIKEVSAHIPTIQKTISAMSGVDDFMQERFMSLCVPNGLTGAQILHNGDQLFISTLHEWNKNPLYSIEIVLNSDVLRQTLEQFEIYPGSSSFLLWTGQNELIASSTSDPALTDAMVLEDEQRANTHNNGVYFIVTAKSDYLGMSLWRYIPQEAVMAPMRTLYVGVWVFSILTGILILIYLFFVFRAIHRPLSALVAAFQRIETGDFSVVVPESGEGEFCYLCRRFNKMTNRLETLVNQSYRQHILMQRAEMKQLQAQINPHFLYNSIFLINTMARVGDEQLIAFTQHLGEYFRFITRSGTDEVILSEELTHAKNYAQIQRMRFSKRLTLTIGECPDSFLSLHVPRLILQPLLENAFEYAVEKRSSGCVVAMNFTPLPCGLAITVEDNGNGMSDEKLAHLLERLGNERLPGEVTGLINVHRRVQLAFGSASGLSVARSGMGGLCVTLTMIWKEAASDVSIADR